MLQRFSSVLLSFKPPWCYKAIMVFVESVVSSETDLVTEIYQVITKITNNQNLQQYCNRFSLKNTALQVLTYKRSEKHLPKFQTNCLKQCFKLLKFFFQIGIFILSLNSNQLHLMLKWTMYS